MIRKLFNNPLLVTQSISADVPIAEPCIAVHRDNGDLIVLTQGDNEILINPETVSDLCKALKLQLKDIAESQT